MRLGTRGRYWTMVPCFREEPMMNLLRRVLIAFTTLVLASGGSQALTAVLGGSADVVSGYFDHCVNLAAKNQALEAFVVYDRFPGLALVVGPKNTAGIASVKDLANMKVGVSAPGSSTDFFL